MAASWKRRVASAAKDKLEALLTHRGTGKVKFDSWVDPFLLTVGSTAGFIYAYDRLALNQVAERTDVYEGVAMMSAYGAGAALLAGTFAGSIFAGKKLHKWHKDRLRQRKQVYSTPSTLLHPVLPIALVAALWNTPAVDVPRTIDNYQTDFARIGVGVDAFVQSFARGAVAPVPVILAEETKPILPEEPIGVASSSVAGSLEGRSFGTNPNNLFSLYTGVTGRMPASPQVDFCAQLDRTWELKFRRFNETGAAIQARQSLMQECRNEDPGRMTLEEYVADADRAVKKVSINWESVGRNRLDSDRRAFLDAFSQSVQGKDMIAYALTELMPSEDGRLNIAVMDYMLRNGGRRFVESIAAMGDPLSSFGPYQFTSYAIMDSPDGRNGASIMNRYATSGQIEGSVNKLRGDAHHRAAYLFAMQNMTEFVQGLERGQFSTLMKQWRSEPIDTKRNLIAMVAMSHHSPTNGRRIGKAWLNDGGDESIARNAYGRFTPYARKTIANYSALNSGAPTPVITQQPAAQPRAQTTLVDAKRTLNNAGFELVNSRRGEDVFRYEVQQGGMPGAVLNRFNTQDTADSYENPTAVLTADGDTVPRRQLARGTVVYVAAKPRP